MLKVFFFLHYVSCGMHKYLLHLMFDSYIWLVMNRSRNDMKEKSRRKTISPNVKRSHASIWNTIVRNFNLLAKFSALLFYYRFCLFCFSGFSDSLKLPMSRFGLPSLSCNFKCFFFCGAFNCFNCCTRIEVL